jgi:uncharacterized protein (TIGR03437 family)
LKLDFRCTVIAFSLMLALSPAFAGRVTATFPVGHAGNVRIMKQDLQGNVYLAGDSGSDTNSVRADSDDAVVAKISSSGKLLFWTSFGGSKADYVTAIAVAADGSVAVIGSTASKDFPLTPDSAQTQFVTTNMGTTGFFVRLDPSGKVIYSSFLNTNFSTPPNSSAPSFQPSSIVLDSTGAVFITGLGSYTSTPGALPAVENAGWILRLDGSGKIVMATGAIGGGPITLDSQGSINIVGNTDSGVPVTPGAFQSTITPNSCGGNAILSFSCFYQYVAKLDSSASHVIYATWIDGSYGAGPSALAVDDAGDLILAGGTQSTDYPVTPGAYQRVNYATLGPRDNSPVAGGSPLEIPITGHVTKLNATGTGLIFSTYLGGSGEDMVTAMATDAAGQIYLGGITSSPDFPGVPVAPDACHPSFVYPTVFATRLSSDGSFLSETQLAFGLAPDIPGPYGPNVMGILGSIALDGQGKATALMAGTLATIDLFAAPSALICTTDAASLAPLNSVAPGQLVSLFGRGIGPDVPVSAQPQGGAFPRSLGGVSVMFDGIAAPILYASGGQVNVQVPYEIAGSPSVMMKLQPPIKTAAASVEFGVVPSHPSVFLEAAEFVSCNDITTSSVPPVALNADGSVNSCSNPAAAETSVRVFLNGLGTTAGGNPVTGAISTIAKILPASGTATLSAVTLSTTSEPLSLASSVGEINSVVVATIAIPQVGWPSLQVALAVNGMPVLDSVVIWVKSN